MVVKPFAPKSDNRRHFWAVLGPAKSKSKFEILIVNIFCLKQKTNQILSAAIEKINFFLFKKTIYGSFRQGITMEKCKTRAIQADLTIFTHIPAYSGMFTTLCNSGVTPKYSEPCQTSTMERFANVVNDYNDFRNISFSLSLLSEKICIF